MSTVSRKKKTSYIVMYASKLTRSTNRAPDLEHPGAHAQKLILRRDAHSRVKRKVDRVSIGRALHGVTCDAFLIWSTIDLFDARNFSTKNDVTNNRKVKLPVLYYEYRITLSREVSSILNSLIFKIMTLVISFLNIYNILNPGKNKADIASELYYYQLDI